jgi:hypothetical protein
MPWKDKETGRAWSREYTKRIHREGTSWAAKHPDQVKAKRRRRTLKQYGLTPEQWDAKFEAQGRACAICKSPEPKGPNWATDHDHRTGEVRGILCGSCNAGLGQMQDNPTVLRLAAEYVERNQK